MHFMRKPRHVTPQIDRLGKMSTVLRVSIHINGVSKEIYGKMFIFRVSLGMYTSNQSYQKNSPCYECFNTYFWGFSGDRWENIHL